MYGEATSFPTDVPTTFLPLKSVHAAIASYAEFRLIVSPASQSSRVVTKLIPEAVTMK